MTTPSLLISTWDDGLYNVTGDTVRHEIAEGSVCSVVADGRGGALAIVDAHALHRRSAGGEWAAIATSDIEIACCIPVGDVIFVGTTDARILRVDPDGALRILSGFETVEGRDDWYAGTAIVDGRVVGPPLGVRSMTATCDGAALLANVHVGGIPKSTDSGATWRPTIHVDRDVHQVCAHPTRPDLAIAAAAVGLCISRDAGTTWTIESEGLHTPFCSAVAFGREHVFVAAATDPFATQGAVYRRPIDGDGSLQRLGGGMPEWLSGHADTNCIATRDSTIAVIDGSGGLYLSHDDGDTWSSRSDRLPVPSGLHIC
jgi:hypothetical protein